MPLSASGEVRDRYYGRNVKFSRAVDELVVIRREALAQLESEQQRRIQNLSSQPITSASLQISLKRLTADEINDAQNGNFSRFQSVRPMTQNQTAEETPIRKYNLRKRNK